MRQQAVLFLNGEIDGAFYQSYQTKHQLRMPIYCTDGAYRQLVNFPNMVDTTLSIIGDGDSLSVNDIVSKHHHYYLEVDQNGTDFAKALHKLVQQGISRVLIFGAGGGEVDHCLANFSVALSYAKSIQCEFIDQYSRAFFLRTSPTILEDVAQRMISVLPLCRLERVTLKGCQYPLKRETLQFGVRDGVRNIALDHTVTITYEGGSGLVFISHQAYHSHTTVI